ncbi:hypothetical protein BDZ45DRAFT_751089 [Acephala macrosclerotiorum]|nr:hypothetical protein BDZ45DRAFT_751089 [Acephala macrosclerotiorum]
MKDPRLSKSILLFLDFMIRFFVTVLLAKLFIPLLLIVLTLHCSRCIRNFSLKIKMLESEMRDGVVRALDYGYDGYGIRSDGSSSEGVEWGCCLDLGEVERRVALGEQGWKSVAGGRWRKTRDG